MDDVPREILFICTGNYYRSRFAEAVFNHRAEANRLPWRARSRGLNIHWIIDQSELSPYTRTALTARGIDPRHTGTRRMPVSRGDLARAERVIALKRREHYPMMLHQFPDWAERVTYWTVDDIDRATPEEALPRIESLVAELIQQLAKQ